jgi:hypothetical protein
MRGMAKVIDCGREQAIQVFSQGSSSTTMAEPRTIDDHGVTCGAPVLVGLLM